MPETIKAYIVILFLGSATLYFHRIKLPAHFSNTQLKQWQFLWVTVTGAAFLSHNYWLFVILSIILIKSQDTQLPSQRFSNYLFLLPALPFLAQPIPGFADINLIFVLNYPRLLSLVILLPLFLSQSNKSLAFLKMPGDKLLSLFLLVNIIISTRNGEVTNILRTNFYLFLDVFLPYYVASRALTRFYDFEQVSYGIFTICSLLALLALFESVRAWSLFSSLNYSLDITQARSAYLYREGLLRADGPFSSGIVLGYVLMIGLGMGLTIKNHFHRNKLYLFGSLVITIGLITTLSRGPWVGTAFMIVTYLLLSKNKAANMNKLLLAGLAASPILFFTTIGQKLINMLPFVGNIESNTISYRQLILEQSWTVIQRHPFLGSNTYLSTPEMQSLIQGQGIIDIVNSYVRVALHSGLIGLFSFVLIFLSLIYKLYKTKKHIPSTESKIYNYANALIAVMLGMLLIIATVSSIDVVPHFYWVMAGIMSGYINFISSYKKYGSLSTVQP